MSERESALLAGEAKLDERLAQLARTVEELDLREARLSTDLDLREDELEERERAVAQRGTLIDGRERDLTAYVGEVQDRFTERSVA
jgi:hypothetical protein